MPPLFATMYAVSGLPWPDTMSVLPPYTSGVMEFVVERASNGTLHRSWPLAAFTPTRFFCENTIDLARAADLRDDRRAVGGTVAGPCPFHCAGRGIERRQRAVVVATDVQNHLPPSTIGDIAV